MLKLSGHSKLLVKQAHELGEWFGFETRNKFQILDETGQPVAYAAEQQKGIFGFLARQFLGHWRSFEFHLFTPDRRKVLTARQPFRIWFQRLELFGAEDQLIGVIQLRWAIFTKKFDVLDARGNILMRVASPLFSIWTFPFIHAGRECAVIRKKWSGVFLEAFTDKDSFLVEFSDEGLSEEDRHLVLASALFIDLRYFENNQGSRLVSLFD